MATLSGRLDDRDRLIVAGLALLVLLTRLPFLTTVLYNWDSANFALAIRQYDVTQHQPHPPGYLYFVGLGWLVHRVVPDVNTSLVIVALAFSVLAVPTTYLLGRHLFAREVAVVAALFVASSVTFWSYGGLALTYPALGFFSSAVALLAYRVGWLGDRRSWPLLAVMLALASGFRPELLAFLGPLWLVASIRAGWRAVAGGAGILAIGLLAWLAPAMALSGGVDQYLTVLRAYTDRDVLDRYSTTRNGLAGLVGNLRDIASYSWYSLYALALPLAAAPIAWLFKRCQPDGRWLLFLLWLGPMFLFYFVIHIGDAGYAFNYLPAFALIGAKGLQHATSSLMRLPARATFWVAAAVFVGVNTGIYLLYPRALTAPGILAQDRAMATRLAYLRSQPNDGQSLLLSYDSFRHLQYYLPEWQSSLWADPFAAKPVTTALAPEIRWIIVVDSRLLNETGERPAAEPVAEGTMARIPVQAGQVLTFGAGTLSLR